MEPAGPTRHYKLRKGMVSLMADEWTKVSDAPLFDEHLLLGGVFEDEEPLLALPARYGSADEERAALGVGCGLSDLAGMSVLLVSGAAAENFMNAACAGKPLTVGECSFGAVVTGDGSVAAVPLVARTGDEEYLLVDPTEQGLALMPWLTFLAGIDSDGFRPFEGVSVSDVSTALHPLLLWGPQAPHVLSDYTPKGALPERGTVENLALDRIVSLVAAPVCGDMPCYLLLVPPQRARALWRSFLSFTVVGPVGLDALSSHARDALGWLSNLVRADEPDLDHRALVHHGLARPDGGYVGERALKQSV